MRSSAKLHAARRRLLSTWAKAITARPRLTLILCIAFAALSAAHAALNLAFESDRDKLIDPSLPWQRRYAEFKKHYPRWDDAIIVVDTQGNPNSPLISSFLTTLEERLRADTNNVSAVTAGFPTSEAPPGLVLAEPLDRVQSIADSLKRSAPALAAPSLAHLISLPLLSPTPLNEADRAELTTLLTRAAHAASDPGAPLLLDVPPTQRLTTPSGNLALVLVSLRANAHVAASVNSNKASAVTALRNHLTTLQQEPRYSSISAGVTGVPVLEADETTLSTNDATRASIIATLCITLLSIAVYRRVSIPLLIIASLLLGLAASFAWATLAVGRLQVLSVVFMVMLVGLGADMTVHLIARLEVTHPDHAHMPRAILNSFRSAGPGILTGSITTALAFAATALTPFAGVAELGLIAAGGVLLCTLLSLSAFPAALVLLPSPEKRLRARKGGVSRPFLSGRLNVIDRHPKAVIALWALLLLALTPFALRVRYDTDLLKLLPDAAESVQWERRLSADDERSVWHAVVLAHSVNEARYLTESLRALPEVSDVSAAGLLFPDHLTRKQSILSAVPAPPSPLPEADPLDPRAPAARLAQRYDSLDPALARAARALTDVPDTALTNINTAFNRDRAQLAHTLSALRSATPPTTAQLPEALRHQFLGADGSLLLRVFPRASDTGQSVLAPERLAPFMNAVLDVAPNATGPTNQIFQSAKVITNANAYAALLAALAILATLLFDFRSLPNVLCALLPVGVAILVTLSLLGALHIPLNFANTIVAPLILGLGVTAGVNAVHRWIQQPADKPAGLAGGAGRAITFTLATTIIGFASMLTADHRGVRSLGLVMTLGLAAVWIATVLLLPAVLRLRTSKTYDGPRARRSSQPHPNPHAPNQHTPQPAAAGSSV